MATLRTCHKRAKLKREGYSGKFRRTAKRYRVKEFLFELNNNMAQLAPTFSLESARTMRCEVVRDNRGKAGLSDESVKSLLLRSIGIVRTRALTDGSYCHTITAS